MQFYIGQEVSLLHDHGVGKVVSIVDKYHVEVDFGDDFPYDVHIEEIIPVDPEEKRFFQVEEEVRKEEPSTPQHLGVHLFDLSLAVVPEPGGTYRLYLVNPEASDALFTVYMKTKGKFLALANGKAPAGGKDNLAVLSGDELQKVRSLYFQVLFFKSGSGHPQAPLTCELPWQKNALDDFAEPIAPLAREGWLFSLRKPQEQDVPAFADEHEYLALKKEGPTPGPPLVVDLHIEELTARPHQLSSSEMLALQLEHFEKALSDGLLQHAEKLVLIHGIGAGKLKAEIRHRLGQHPRVKSHRPADPGRYGNGATEVFLK